MRMYFSQDRPDCHFHSLQTTPAQPHSKLLRAACHQNPVHCILPRCLSQPMCIISMYRKHHQCSLSVHISEHFKNFLPKLLSLKFGVPVTHQSTLNTAEYRRFKCYSCLPQPPQIWTLKINDPADCGEKFRANRHLGMLLFVGIVAGNLLKG